MEIDGLSKTNCYSNGALADQLSARIQVQRLQVQ